MSDETDEQYAQRITCELWGQAVTDPSIADGDEDAEFVRLIEVRMTQDDRFKRGCAIGAFKRGAMGGGRA